MNDGITLHILGDFGPFSRMGKSIGYQVTVGNSTYLIDCGAPLFQQIGGHGLQKVKGLIITHVHDDHKRWFSDLALFNMYAPDIDGKVSFFTSDDIHEDIMVSSKAALDRSLSQDSRAIIDIPYDEYVDFRTLGPRSKYRIATIEDGPGCTKLLVMDNNANEVGPERAKIVVNPATKRPRLLFKDPDSGEWIEPESYYPFASGTFYESDRNIFTDPEGFSIEAIKAPVWHGVPAIGVKISTGSETLIFSSDTVNHREIWESLYKEKRAQDLKMSKEGFDAASIIVGDINDYIERVWSEQRYNEAILAFTEGVVIHDITIGAGAVHTEYHKLDKAVLNKENVILTHSPDKITSEWVLSNADKFFRIKGGSYYEVVSDELKVMNADIYHKEKGRYYVGYKSYNGKYTVYDKGGILGVSADNVDYLGRPIYKIDMYEDISGMYFPRLDSDDERYWKRPDGSVEMIKLTKDGSVGRVVKDLRDSLSGKV